MLFLPLCPFHFRAAQEEMQTVSAQGEAHRATYFSKIFVLDLLLSLAQENIAACVPCCQPFVFFSYGVLLSHAAFNLSS